MTDLNQKKTCFVIAPIGDQESDTRIRSDQVLKHIITPAIEECGYVAIRSDKISQPGIITTQVIQHLLDAPLVVADLTDHNPNVFYELAIRHAVRKPIVQIIKTGQQIPFDVAQSRTIQYDHHDLDSVERCKKELIQQVKFVEQDPSRVDTPISVAIDLQSLKQSDNPVEKNMAKILSMLQDMRLTINSLVRDQRLRRLKEIPGLPRSPELSTSLPLSLSPTVRQYLEYLSKIEGKSSSEKNQTQPGSDKA